MVQQTLPDRLPIKVILPKQGAEKRTPGGGKPPEPFRPVDKAYRTALTNQVAAIKGTLSQNLEVAPIRVKLISQATAKTHRPEKLFSESTCPIIGAGKQGELFLKATPSGLKKLESLIENGNSAAIVKELSSIETIEPVTANYRRRGRSNLDILKNSPRRGQRFVSRVKLFDMGKDTAQEKLVENFINVCKEKGLSVNKGGYSDKSLTFEVQCADIDDLDAVTQTIGVRSVSAMPVIRIVRPQSKLVGPMPKLPIRPTGAEDYPVVVVVDSGVSSSIKELESWVVGRTSDVAPQYRDPDHGTFVGGLVCFGAHLNPTVEGLDETPIAIYDLQVIPNADPSKGDTENLTESEFLQTLEAALKEHANKYKVWNLSLGTDSVCSLDEFSPLAEHLDNFQEQYQVSFVISAGNFNTVPLLSYPRSGDELENGRMTSPADSVLGITVGSVSHVDYKKAGPKSNELSSFSRHGAGPNYIIKPDLVHFGGSCSYDGTHMSGIQSLSDSGCVEDMGTSFSAPLVSRTLAQIYHQITPIPNPVLARAILTHSARDPRTKQRVPDGEENFFGFGLPSSLQNSLECTPHTSTLIFDDVLRPGFFLEWDHFPYPQSLYRNGKFFGEIWMTIAMSPSRGARWGTEYCETHIEANFGVYRDVTSRATGEIKSKFVGLVPPEHKNPGKLYESYQIESLRKWAPVRTYYGDMGEKGERGDRWRLKLSLLTRHNGEDDPPNPQPFSLIVTISDPTKKARVYDEMAQIIRTRFQSQNLTVRNSLRVQSQVGMG